MLEQNMHLTETEMKDSISKAFKQHELRGINIDNISNTTLIQLLNKYHTEDEIADEVEAQRLRNHAQQSNNNNTGQENNDG